MKLSNKTLKGIVQSVSNRCGLGQRQMARRFHVHHSTISRNLRRRTSDLIRKRRRAVEMDNEDQEKGATKNCDKLY
ncbi:unnamed protein product, partial [Rotaria sp. Silwood2]